MFYVGVQKAKVMFITSLQVRFITFIMIQNFNMCSIRIDSLFLYGDNEHSSYSNDFVWMLSKISVNE